MHQKNIKMIQRIQSVFLLFSAIFSLLILIIPISYIGDNTGDVIKFTIIGFYTLSDSIYQLTTINYSLIILLAVIFMINIVAIFLYKKRNIQMRLSIYSIVLNIGLLFLFFYYIYQITNGLSVKYSFSFSLIIPLIILTLNILAFRSIKKDDNLIKSMNRLR